MVESGKRAQQIRASRLCDIVVFSARSPIHDVLASIKWSMHESYDMLPQQENMNMSLSTYMCSAAAALAFLLAVSFYTALPLTTDPWTRLTAGHFTMRSSLLPFTSLLSVASAFDCTPAAFSSHLPSNAHVAYTRFIPNGGTFDVPASDIAYPTSPTGLQAACAVQVNVTSSPTSAFSFGLFLPANWNERFL